MELLPPVAVPVGAPDTFVVEPPGKVTSGLLVGIVLVVVELPVPVLVVGVAALLLDVCD